MQTEAPCAKRSALFRACVPIWPERTPTLSKKLECFPIISQFEGRPGFELYCCFFFSVPLNCVSVTIVAELGWAPPSFVVKSGVFFVPFYGHSCYRSKTGLINSLSWGDCWSIGCERSVDTRTWSLWSNMEGWLCWQHCLVEKSYFSNFTKRKLHYHECKKCCPNPL